jgi:hypothetical protein
MGRPFIKGGTPIGSESLCRTCTHAHMMTGYRESELVTMCEWVNPNIVVPFKIYECTGYYDKNRPSWDDMQKFALHIRREKPVGFKTSAGFQTAVTVRVAERDEDEDDETEDDD